MLILVYCLIGIIAAVTIVTLTGFNVDLAAASFFYDPARRDFIGVYHHLSRFRDHGSVAVWTCILIVGSALTRFLPWRLPSVAPRVAVYLTLGLLLGPGLLVNGIFKEHWGRPRPIEVVQFGGAQQFVNWWDPSGSCPTNCSFVSGEASTAAWMIGPAMLVPGPWRAVAVTAAAAFTVAMSGLRLSVGGHFLTDALFGVLVTLLALLFARTLVERAAGPFTCFSGRDR